MSNILVTGATGFIGSHLVEKLLKNEENNLIILKRSFSDMWRVEKTFNKYKERIHLFNVDVENLENVFKEYTIEGIFHLATYYNKNPEYTQIMELTQSNITFPIELLNLAVQYNVKYFINTGTFSEYKLNEHYLVENYDIKNPKTFYDATKIAFEDILKYYYKNYPINTATVKVYSPYGERDDERKIIPYIIINTLNGNPVEIRNPHNYMNLVYVEDIVELFLFVQSKILNLENYEIFHAKNSKVYPITEINEKIQEIISNFDEKQNKRVEENVESWVPKISLEEGLYNTIKFYKKKYDL